MSKLSAVMVVDNSAARYCPYHGFYDGNHIYCPCCSGFVPGMIKTIPQSIPNKTTTRLTVDEVCRLLEAGLKYGEILELLDREVL